jgi:hypothetical protein
VCTKKKRREKKLEEKNTKKKENHDNPRSLVSLHHQSHPSLSCRPPPSQPPTPLTPAFLVSTSLPPLQQPIFSHIEKPLSSIFHHRSNSLLLNTIGAISKRKPSCNNHFKQI